MTHHKTNATNTHWQTKLTNKFKQANLSTEKVHEKWHKGEDQENRSQTSREADSMSKLNVLMHKCAMSKHVPRQNKNNNCSNTNSLNAHLQSIASVSLAA